MRVIQKEQSKKQFRTRFLWRAYFLCIVIIFLIVLVSPRAYSGNRIKANDVLLPQQLGEIQTQVEGKAGPLVFIIGETHVSLKVQQAVADIIGYLRGAYGVTLVCTEGYSGTLTTSRWSGSLVASRMSARADLIGRQINAVEYIARVYPDVRVIGVEDMNAYDAHGAEMDKYSEASERLNKDAMQWANDFKQFLMNDLGNMRVTKSEVERIKSAFEQFAEDNDFDTLAEVLLDVAGRESSVGKKLVSLLERKKSLENAAKQITANSPTTPDSPEMAKRDKAIVSKTLQNSKNSSVVALIVGKLHLPGIEKELNAKKVSYVTIFPIGLDEEVTPELADNDQNIYEQWRRGTKTPFEEWLSQYKPLPASGRSSFVERTDVLGPLWNADLMLRQGATPEEVLQVTNSFPLPEGFCLERCFSFTEGNGVEFTVNGRKAYMYFSNHRLTVPGGRSYNELEKGEANGRYYVIYDGGDSRFPPIPPDDNVSAPGDYPYRNYPVAVDEKDRDNPSSVIISFWEDEGQLYRAVDKKKRSIGVLPADVQPYIKAFRESDPGPEFIFAAQKLNEMLLVDLNEDMPSGRRVLYQSSQDDLLEDISLPAIAKLANSETARSLESIEEVYNIPWKEKENLADLVRQQAPKVNIRQTIVLLSDTFRNLREYQSAIQAIRETGATVNEVPSEGGDTIILLGSSTDTTWTVRLDDGSSVNQNSPQFQRLLQNAKNVMTLNINIPEALRNSVKRLHPNWIEANSSEILKVGTQLVEAIRNGTNTGSMDYVLRRFSTSQETTLREQLTNKQALSEMADSVSDRFQNNINLTATELRMGI